MVLLMNKHLKQQQKNISFIFNLLTPPLKYFFHTLSTSKRNYFISGINKNLMCRITFFYMSMTVIKVTKNHILLKSLTFYETNLRLYFFFAFSLAQPKTKAETPDGKVEQRRDQHKVKLV